MNILQRIAGRVAEMLSTDEPSTRPPVGSVLRQQLVTQSYAKVVETIGLFNPKRVSIADYILMRDDSDVQFGSALHRASLINAEWTVESNDPLIKAFIEHVMRQAYVPFAEAGSLAIGFGYQVIEKVWKSQEALGLEVKSADGGKDQTKTLPVAWVFDKFKAIDPRTVVLHVDEKTDDWDGVMQSIGPVRPSSELVGLDRVALWSFRKADVFGRLTGYPMFKHSYSPWWDKSAIKIYANRYFEMFGGPVPVGRADAGGKINIDGVEMDGMSFLGALLAAYKSGNAIVMPSDRDEISKEFLYDIEFKELPQSGQNFENYLRFLKEEILQGQLVPPRVGQAKGGSELGSKEPAVQADQMDEFHEKNLGEFFSFTNEQLVDPLGRFNFPKEQWEASKTRLVPSGISAGQKSLYRDLLFKAIDEEMSLGPGKHAPIFRRVKLDEVMSALKVPQASAQELEELEAEAAADAQQQAEIDKAAAAAPRGPVADPALTREEQSQLLAAVGYRDEIDLDAPVRRNGSSR